MVDVNAELTRLAELRDRGAITPAEFESQRAALLQAAGFGQPTYPPAAGFPPQPGYPPPPGHDPHQAHPPHSGYPPPGYPPPGYPGYPGQPAPATRPNPLLIGGAVVLGALGLAYAGGYIGKKPVTEPTAAATPAPVDVPTGMPGDLPTATTEPAAQPTAAPDTGPAQPAEGDATPVATILQAYRADPVAAGNQYNNRPLTISGDVSDITDDHDMLRFASDDDNFYIIAQPPEGSSNKWDPAMSGHPAQLTCQMHYWGELAQHPVLRFMDCAR